MAKLYLWEKHMEKTGGLTRGELTWGELSRNQ